MVDAARTAYLFRCQGKTSTPYRTTKPAVTSPDHPAQRVGTSVKNFSSAAVRPCPHQSWPKLFSGGSWITATMCGGDGAAIPSVPPDECIRIIVKPRRSEPGHSSAP
jgi:hypothetical protein